MDERKKIAVIGLKGLPAFGGAASVGENIVCNLSNKYNFTVYATKSHTSKPSGQYQDYYLKVFDKIPFKRLNTLYYYFLSILHALLFGNYDLIHIHHRDALLLGLLLKLKYPIMITTHGGHRGVSDKWRRFNWLFDLQVRFFLRYYNSITCVAKNEQRILFSKYNIKANYIPNGGFNRNSIVSFENQFNLPQEYIVFVAGRIISLKGLHILLDALNMINYKQNLVVIGDLSHEKKYSSLIFDKSKGLNVHFLGLIKNKNELSYLIKKSKYLVFPSIYEAMSMVLLETISIGVPVICSNIIENKDIFSSNEVLFFNSNDIMDLSKKIEFAENHHLIMKEKAQKALQRVDSEYNWSIISNKYDMIYKKLLNITEQII